jgi:hypothetical protein
VSFALKMTPEMVKTVVDRATAGDRLQTIADDIGVSVALVSKVTIANGLRRRKIHKDSKAAKSLQDAVKVFLAIYDLEWTRTVQRANTAAQSDVGQVVAVPVPPSMVEAMRKAVRHA